MNVQHCSHFTKQDSFLFRMNCKMLNDTGLIHGDKTLPTLFPCPPFLCCNDLVFSGVRVMCGPQTPLAWLKGQDCRQCPQASGSECPPSPLPQHVKSTRSKHKLHPLSRITIHGHCHYLLSPLFDSLFNIRQCLCCREKMDGSIIK